MTGIYKITSPSDKVYIGQSWNIDQRWKTYHKPSGAVSQTKLYNSFTKHGVEEHRFEIIHELPHDCSQEVMDATELVYTEAYIDVGIEVMNLRLGGISNGKISEEARDRMSKAQLGKRRAPFTEEHLSNMSKARLGKKMPEGFGRKVSESKKGKPSSKKGIKIPQELLWKYKEVSLRDDVRQRKSNAMKKIWADKKLKEQSI